MTAPLGVEILVLLFAFLVRGITANGGRDECLSANRTVSGDMDQDVMACPIWKDHLTCGRRPNGTVYSACLKAKSKRFLSEGGYTSVTLHQTEESWQQDARRDQIVSEIELAIRTGLRLFGTHAGTASHPLQIHATIANSEKIPPESESYYGPYVLYDAAVRSNSTPGDTDAQRPLEPPEACYLAITFFWKPLKNETAVLTRLRKDVVRYMYYCVEQYHQPRLDLRPDRYATPRNDFAGWWAKGVARFFDGLAWPATADVVHQQHSPGTYFPEEYQWWTMLLEQEEAAAIFWHSALSSPAGWDAARVSAWVAARNQSMPDTREISEFSDWFDRKKAAEKREMTALSRDADFCALFHHFGRNVVEGRITYPSPTGDVVINTTERAWAYLNVDPEPVSLQPGHWVDLRPRDPVYPHSWHVYRFEVAIVGGQALKMFLYNDSTLYSRSWLNDTELSFREIGGPPGNWTVTPANRSVTLDVPGGAGGSNRLYEFVLTSTTADRSYWPALRIYRQPA